MDFIFQFAFITAITVGVLMVLVMAFWSRYKTVGPDQAMIITGSFLGNDNVHIDESGRKIKIIRGGGAFIIPIFQQYQFLPLRSYKIDVTTPEVYTEKGVPVMCDGVAMIKIGSLVEDIATAAEQFMGKQGDAVSNDSKEVLEGHLRAILGTMSVEDIYKNRDKFAQEVQDKAVTDLKKMGLSIVSFTIKDIKDRNGYLDALGKPQIAAVKRDADIAQAEADRETRQKKAHAEEIAKKAELLKETNVAEAEKEKELKVAAFKKEQDQAKAIADRAYEIQAAVSDQAVVEEKMKIQLVEKEKQIQITEREAQRAQREYEATIVKKAEAEALATKTTAEAMKTRQILEAQAKAETVKLDGEASASATKAKGEAEAEIVRKRGNAEAEILAAKGKAEAEAKEALATAFEKFGQAAVLDMFVKMMPEMAARIAEPMKQIEKITVVDTGNGAGAGRVANYATELMATLPDMIKDVSGLDVKQMLNNLTSNTDSKS